MNKEIVQSTLQSIPAHIGVSTTLINISSLGIQHALCNNHMHDELEFLYVTNGEFLCIVNGVTYKAYKGDIIFVNSRIPHYTATFTDNTVYSMLQFSPDNFSNDNVMEISKYLSRFINISTDHIIIFKNNDKITEELTVYLENIFKEFTNKKTAYELYIKSNIYKIIAFLSRYNILTDSSIFFDEKTISKVMPALNYIDKHYTDQIELSELSSIVNLNQSYFCRLFKKATNSTFIEYLNFVRICKSERLLSTTTDSIGYISSELGFASVSYFNKIFKKFKGCTPTEYRKSKYSLQ